MSMSGASAGHGVACREVRQLLGVYVVGAIDPAERSVVDSHLADCQFCRDELAGLAALPAMLSRVPGADVERLALPTVAALGLAEPPPELLEALLRKASARRRRLSVVAVAAAVAVIFAGVTAAVLGLTGSGPGQQARPDVASNVSPSTHVGAVVDYTRAPWGSAMRIQVSGINAGTSCQFWVIGSNGRRTLAGHWTVGAYSTGVWYSASAAVSPDSVRAFQITSGNTVLVGIPVR